MFKTKPSRNFKLYEQSWAYRTNIESLEKNIFNCIANYIYV